MKIRHHRGTLADSMKTRVTIDPDEASIRQFLGLSPDQQVVVKPYGFDDRVNEDTHLVVVDGYPHAMVDGPLS